MCGCLHTCTHIACCLWQRKKLEPNTGSYTPPTHVQREHSVTQLLSCCSHTEEARAPKVDTQTRFAGTHLPCKSMPSLYCSTSQSSLLVWLYGGFSMMHHGNKCPLHQTSIIELDAYHSPSTPVLAFAQIYCCMLLQKRPYLIPDGLKATVTVYLHI